MKQHLDALIQSYLTHMGRVDQYGEKFVTMLGEVRRLELLQRRAGAEPYRERLKEPA